MRFLANENFPLDAVTALREVGHDVRWIRSDEPGISDQQVLEHALTENRVLLTFDKDFGELAFREGIVASCGIVLFRLMAGSAQELAAIITLALSSRDDWNGRFSVVEPGRIRIRTLK